jgi:hypothetical protein
MGSRIGARFVLVSDGCAKGSGREGAKSEIARVVTDESCVRNDIGIGLDAVANISTIKHG